MRKYIEKDGIKHVLELTFAFTAGKDLYNTIGVDVKFGMNTYLHCSVCFLIRQKPVIEKYQLNSFNAGSRQELTLIRAGDSRIGFMTCWWDRINLESLQIESIKMIKVLDA